MTDITQSPDWILQHRFNLFPNKDFDPSRTRAQCIEQLSKEIEAAETLELDIDPSNQFLELQFNNQKLAQSQRKLGTPEEEIRKIFDEQRKKSFQLRQTGLNRFNENTLKFPNGFTSRLNRFWTNHFCIEPGMQITRAFSVSYPNEAILPFVFDRFDDMLKAAIKHPGMLKYLNNDASAGPNSTVGKKRNLSINENLAREILELHTLGVHGGYQHTDITNLAYILSGWTFRKKLPAGTTFVTKRHEPGNFTLLNKTFGTDKESNGKNQLDEALSYLAGLPATARFICKKLLKHFLPESHSQFEKSLSILTNQFQSSKGHLSSVYQELIKLEPLWENESIYYKQPDEWLFSLVRLFPGMKDIPWVEKKCVELSKPTFAPESPAGWPDDNSLWMTPEGLYRQKEVASEAAFRFRGRYEQEEIIKQTIGSVENASEHTQLALSQCKNKQQTFITLAMSPENLFR